MHDGGGVLDALDIAVYRHVFVGRVQVVLRRAEARQHRRVRDAEHDDALNRHALHQGLRAEDALGGADGGLADGLSSGRLVGVFSGGVDDDLKVAVTALLQVPLQLPQLALGLEPGRTAKVELGGRFRRDDGLTALAGVARPKPADIRARAEVRAAQQV